MVNYTQTVGISSGSGSVTISYGSQSATTSTSATNATLSVPRNGSVTYTATPASGYVFVKWECSYGDQTSNPYTWGAATAPRTYLAVFANASIQHTISVASANPDMGSVSGGGSGVIGTTVSIQATAGTGYTFDYWSLSPNATSTIASDSSASTSVTIGSTNDTVTAHFKSNATGGGAWASGPGTDAITSYTSPLGAGQFNLFVRKSAVISPTISIVVIDETICTTTCTEYDHESGRYTWRVAVTPLKVGSTVLRALITASGTTYQADLDLEITPTTYTIRFNGNGSTSGSMADQPMSYASGTALRKNTFARTDYNFIGWKKDNSGNLIADQGNGSLLTTVQGAVVQLYAQWESVVQTYTLSFVSSDENSGYVTGENPCTVPSGTTMSASNNVLTINTSPAKTITATPYDGCSFSGWSDTSAVTSNRTIVANFTGTPTAVRLRLTKGTQYTSQAVKDNQGATLEAQLVSSPASTVPGVTFTNDTANNHILYTGNPTEAGTYSLSATDSSQNPITILVIVSVPTTGIISYTGNPSQVGTYVLPATDDSGNGISVTVKVTGGEQPGGSGQAYLLKFDNDNNRVQLDLDNVLSTDSSSPRNIVVQKIEDNINAKLSEISTIIYGFDNNVVLDLGTTQKFTVTVTRTQPFPCSDDNIWANQAYWSNGHWAEMVREFFSDWQNLNRDKYGYLNGGCVFHYEPAISVLEDSPELYPVINKNVFLAGQLTFMFRDSTLQKLSVSIPLSVGRMRQDTTGGKDQITYLPNLPGTAAAPTYAWFPRGVRSIAPECPMAWLPYLNGKMFYNWYQTGTATYYQVGSRVPSGVSSLTANWKTPRYAYAVTGGTHTYNVQAGDTKAVVYMVGAGGYGGYGQSSRAGTKGSGGGGGSGDFVIKSILSISENDSISLDAPSPSPMPSSSSSGDGGDAVVTITRTGENPIKLYAAGGKMGGRPTGYNGLNPGKGGAAGGSNGNAGTDGTGSGDVGVGGEGGRIKLSSPIVFNIGETSFTLDSSLYGVGGTGRSATGGVAPSPGKAGAIVLLVYGSD